MNVWYISHWVAVPNDGAKPLVRKYLYTSARCFLPLQPTLLQVWCSLPSLCFSCCSLTLALKSLLKSTLMLCPETSISGTSGPGWFVVVVVVGGGGAVVVVVGFSVIISCSTPSLVGGAFPKLYKVGNVANKGLHKKEQKMTSCT